MGGDFTNNLKKSTNIAIIANDKLGLESLCASIALSEIINKFLETETDFVVSIYFLSDLPKEFESIKDKIKVFNKIGEKTLYLKFSAETVEKVIYNIIDNTKEFELGLVGFKGKKPAKESLSIREEEEKFEMVVGVGFENTEEFEKNVPYVRKIENKFVFNKTNLIGETLVDGVMDLFLKEKVKPTKIASLAFATYYSTLV